MALGKEQLKVRVSKDLAKRVRQCAAVRHTSVNEWVTQAIEAKAAQDETMKVEELEDKPIQVDNECLPGRVTSSEEMLAMVRTFADEDARDGLPTRHKPIEKRSKPAAAHRALHKIRTTSRKI